MKMYSVYLKSKKHGKNDRYKYIWFGYEGEKC